MSERPHGERIPEQGDTPGVRRLLIAIFRIRHSQTVGDPHSGWVLSPHIGLELVKQEIIAKIDVVPLGGHPEVATIFLEPFVIAGRQHVKILAIQVAVLHFREQFLHAETVLAISHHGRKQVQSKKAEEELGWKPIIPLDEGLLQTMKWYESNTEWLTSLQAGEYSSYYEKYYDNCDSSLNAIFPSEPKSLP